MSFHAPHTALRFTLTTVAAATACLLGSTALAQDGQRVEITGSIIKRVADETALPVSIISSQEISQRGHVELKNFLLEMPESSTIGFYAGTVGTLINLRGLGQARSLTLMNGRRFSNEPLTDQYVSANTVPKIAMARVETLRDGASSSYGSDAIGGVQNWITYKTFKGILLKGDLMQPSRSGGGGTTGLGFMAGFGDLETQGWNVYGAAETSSRKVLFRRDRPELSGLNADGTPNTNLSADMLAMGLAGATDLSANQSSPANFFIARNATTLIPSGTVYNPYAATGCASPVTVRSTPTATTCSLNQRYLNTGTYGNGTELNNFYLHGALKLGNDHLLVAEVNHSQNIIDQYSNTVGINNGNYYLSLPKTSKWYPGGSGGVPVVMNGTTTIANAAVASSPSTLYLRWLPLDLGLPEIHDEHINDRIVLSLEGVVAGWDYRTGLNFGQAKRNTRRDRVFNTADLQTGLSNGTLNPFGLQDAAGMAYLQAAMIRDQVVRQVATKKTTLDFTASREMFALAGGPSVLGVGAEVRRDEWSANGFSANSMISVPGAVQNQNNTGIYTGLVPTVYQGAIPNSNQPDPSMSGSAKRDVLALFTELDLPVTKTLNVNLALRADQYKYSYQTVNAVNPKLSARYSPNPMLMFRGSANAGFRAPALPEVFSNADEFRNLTLDDPQYCNSATQTSNNPALTAAQVCNISINEVTKSKLSGTALKPEKSTAWTVGFGLQPVRNLSITLDYWETQVKDMLGTVAADTLVKNYGTYQAQFIRNADGTLRQLMNVKANAGDMRAKGADMSINFEQPMAQYGKLNLGMNVSYLGTFETRLVGSPDWISALATSEPLGITTQDGLTGNRATMHRWKHTASIGWSRGDWSATLSQRYQSKLRDRNEAVRVTAAGSVGERDVAPYSEYALNGSYSGIKGLKLTAGINNLFDVKPPLTNNSRYQGYQTQIADVLGRSYRVSAEYKF